MNGIEKHSLRTTSGCFNKNMQKQHFLMDFSVKNCLLSLIQLKNTIFRDVDSTS